MKIALVDLGSTNYSPLTPEVSPLGGMESGAAYLSRSLARLGHTIYLFNNTHLEGQYDGVYCFHVDKIPHYHLVEKFDVAVSIYCDGERLRSYFGDTPLILFTGHNVGAEKIRNLKDTKEQSYWDKIVFKTNWQAASFINSFGINKSKIKIISSAAAPFFNATQPKKHFFFDENRPPTLYYSSTPFRGLGILIQAFPIIKSHLPGVKAKIFSSMSTHQKPEEDKYYANLYEACISTGMEYIGSLNQKDLACEISKADILAYPSTYAETSCITVMEAMLNSAVIIAHDLGAIAETSGGFGHFIPYNQQNDHNVIVKNYALAVVQTVLSYQKFPHAGRQRLGNQNAYARRNYNWDDKALEWSTFLSEVVSEKRQRQQNITAIDSSEEPVHFVYTITGQKIFLNPKDRRAVRLILSGGNFNPVTMKMWKRLIALNDWNSIIDIGANYGEMLVNCEFQEHAEIYAIEPNPFIHPFLKRTLQSFNKARFFDYAVSDISGYANFRVNQAWSGMSGLSDACENSVQVKTISLVDFIQQEFTIEASRIALLLKIDIEGGEINALRGIDTLLEQFADFVALIEIAHLSNEQFHWIFERFFVVGYNPAILQFISISNPEQLEQFKKTGWKEDVILFRNTDKISDSLALLNAHAG